uniref:L1 transposable element RRM domain-containing protein n=1 Tax=Amphiprion percula TaxID=161767 RepID=A0A3P8T1M0_AMPPE
MAANLRKYKYDGSSNTRPNTSSSKTSHSPDKATPAPAEGSAMDIASVKADILSSLRKEISSVIREELKSTLAEEFDSLTKEIKAVKTEIVNNTAAIRTEIEQMKAHVKTVEAGLSTWSDEVVSVQETVQDLNKQMKDLQEKCEDLEGRMRRGNIRITGVPEHPGSSSPTAVSKLIQEVLQMEKEVRVERSHRSLMQRRPGDTPRVIIARLHNEGDVMDILRRARDRAGQLKYKGNPIAMFPDYTANVAKARAAFTEVRRMLRGRQGIRYGLFYPAKFRISHNNVEKEFVDATKALDYVKKNKEGIHSSNNNLSIQYIPMSVLRCRYVHTLHD